MPIASNTHPDAVDNGPIHPFFSFPDSFEESFEALSLLLLDADPLLEDDSCWDPLAPLPLRLSVEDPAPVLDPVALVAAVLEETEVSGAAEARAGDGGTEVVAPAPAVALPTSAVTAAAPVENLARPPSSLVE